jgi:DtxR family Mn-dependent transcriptional regulator
MLAAMDETTPAIQDYLAAIYDLAGTDKPVIGARLARHMHVSAPSITEAIRRMQKDGYIRVGGRKEIRLTTKGLGIAETMARRRHRRPALPAVLQRIVGLHFFVRPSC